jgi:hypothetical protein
MGNKSTSKENYTDVVEIEEKAIREFEQEIGGFSKNLNEVLAKICVEKDIIKIQTLEEFVLWDFPPTFLNFVQEGYFYKIINGTKYYDAKKIILLAFLFANDNSQSNLKKNFREKASFIFYYIRSRNDQALSEPITENEENFVNFIDDIVDVACVGVVDCYIKFKQIPREGFLFKLRDLKKEIAEIIIKSFFKTDLKQKSSLLTLEALNKLFSEDKFLLTSGYVRSVGWDLIVNGAGNKMERKQIEEENRIRK